MANNSRLVGDFRDATTFDIVARPGDKLSLATMLICTNDGFTGLDRAKLPKKGSAVYLTNGYDAGTEENTESSGDIVDPCSLLGPVELAGDPNGNDDDGVDTDPAGRIAHHPNISGDGDLSAHDHGWTDPVTKVTVTQVSESAVRFETPLSGAGEVPVVGTDAQGRARLELTRDRAAVVSAKDKRIFRQKARLQR